MAAFLHLILTLLVAAAVTDYLLVRAGVSERVALIVAVIFGLLCAFFLR